jgi:hypothetical protein
MTTTPTTPALNWADPDPTKNIVWNDLQTIASKYFPIVELDPHGAVVRTYGSGDLAYADVRGNDFQFPNALNWMDQPIVVRPTLFRTQVAGVTAIVNLAQFYSKLASAVTAMYDSDFEAATAAEFASAYFPQMTATQINAWIDTWPDVDPATPAAPEPPPAHINGQ